jgi:hypothetical protein
MTPMLLVYLDSGICFENEAPVVLLLNRLLEVSLYETLVTLYKLLPNLAAPVSSVSPVVLTKVVASLPCDLV